MGKEFQPLSQERRHGGGNQGRVAVNGSPDSGGMQSLIGAIDTVLPLRYLSACPKSPLKFLILDAFTLGLLWSSHSEWVKFTAPLYHWMVQRHFLFWTRMNLHIKLKMDIFAGLRFKI